MSKKSAFCIASSREQAEKIIESLQDANFYNNDISVLFPDKETTRDFAHEKNTKAPEGAIAGVGTGGVLGGALGWVATRFSAPMFKPPMKAISPSTTRVFLCRRMFR